MITMQNKHLKQSVLTAGVIAGAAVFGGGWQDAHADTVNNTTVQTTATNSTNSTTSTADAQSAVASAQAAVSQAQQSVNSASAAVASASAAQSSAANAASAAQSNYAIASSAAQAQMPSSAEQAAALNGSTIDTKNATLDMFDNTSSDSSANVKNQIGEQDVTENWQVSSKGSKMDPSLKNALTVIPTAADEIMTIDPTNLTAAQQSEIANYVAALINQIRVKFGLTAWIYNDMTLAQALAIVQHAYNDANWNISVKLAEIIAKNQAIEAKNKNSQPDEQETLIDIVNAHDLSKVFDTVDYQYNGSTDKVTASWENVGIISNNDPNIASTLVKTMGDLKRVATVSIWDMLFNDAHSQNSHARMLLGTDTQYVGVAMDKYGVLHIYGLIPSALQAVNDTQTKLADANKDLESQKQNLSKAQDDLNAAKDALTQAEQHLNLLMAIEAVAKDSTQTSDSAQSTDTAQSSTKSTKSKKSNNLKDVTVKATTQPTKTSQSRHGDSQLLTTSNAITTADQSIFQRLLPQTGNHNSFGLTVLGMLMGMLSFGFLGLRKRRY